MDNHVYSAVIVKISSPSVLIPFFIMEPSNIFLHVNHSTSDDGDNDSCYCCNLLVDGMPLGHRRRRSLLGVGLGCLIRGISQRGDNTRIQREEMP
jgi:hypothetical protein